MSMNRTEKIAAELLRREEISLTAEQKRVLDLEIARLPQDKQALIRHPENTETIDERNALMEEIRQNRRLMDFLRLSDLSRESLINLVIANSQQIDRKIRLKTPIDKQKMRKLLKAKPAMRCDITNSMESKMTPESRQAYERYLKRIGLDPSDEAVIFLDLRTQNAVFQGGALTNQDLINIVASNKNVRNFGQKCKDTAIRFLTFWFGENWALYQTQK